MCQKIHGRQRIMHRLTQCSQRENIVEMDGRDARAVLVQPFHLDSNQWTRTRNQQKPGQRPWLMKQSCPSSSVDGDGGKLAKDGDARVFVCFVTNFEHSAPRSSLMVTLDARPKL